MSNKAKSTPKRKGREGSATNRSQKGILEQQDAFPEGARDWQLPVTAESCGIVCSGGCFCRWGFLLVGALVCNIRALLAGVCIRAPVCWKLPGMCSLSRYAKTTSRHMIWLALFGGHLCKIAARFQLDKSIETLMLFLVSAAILE